jgi:hypothetical protein
MTKTDLYGSCMAPEICACFPRARVGAPTKSGSRHNFSGKCPHDLKLVQKNALCDSLPPPRAWHFCRGREGGQMQSLNASGGQATRGGAAAHRTSHRPSPLCTLLEKCNHQPQYCGVAWRRAADGLPRQAGSSTAAQQLKFRKQQSARQGESAACRPPGLPEGRGAVAGLLGSRLIGAACPRAPRGAPCPCQEGCIDRGTLAP